MDKPSFASAYRTAAILAAFSRASASSEEAPQAPWQAAATEDAPRAWSAVSVLVDRAMERLRGSVPVSRPRQLDVGLRPELSQGMRWQSQAPVELQGKPSYLFRRSRGLSHFALYDEAEPGDPAVRTGRQDA